MYFVECGESEKMWLSDNTFKAGGWSAVETAINSQPVCDLSTIPCTHQSTVVKGSAKIKSLGNFGHVGKYPKEISFINIEVVKAVGKCNT